MEDGRKIFAKIADALSNRRTALILGVFVLLLVLARAFSDTLEAMTAGLTVDAVMTVVMTAIVIVGAIALVFYYRRYFSYFKDHAYDPPFGTAPSMQEHYDKYYLSGKVRLNSFGEMVPVDESPVPAAPRGGNTVKDARAETESSKGRPQGTAHPKGLSKSSNKGGTKRKVFAAPKAGRALDTQVEVGPQLRADGSLPTPRELFDAMGAYVIGQEDARRTLAVAVYNHYKRTLADWQPADDVEITKSNIMLLGPTGTGKTLMVQTLARILDVPLAIADATTLTDAGYVGEDVESILARLIQQAKSPEAAELGIVYIDEIDKIARSANANASASHGDPSGEGVQEALLKLLEGSETSVPPLGGRTNLFQKNTQLNTTNILFICGGAFVGLDEIVRKRLTNHGVGFAAPRNDSVTLSDDNVLSQVEPQDLYRFGLIPELVGRIPVITHTKALTADAMVRILTEPRNALVRQYQELFAFDGIELVFEDEALRTIGETALERQTGARGLRSICESILRDSMFELPGTTEVHRVVVTPDLTVRYD